MDRHCETIAALLTRIADTLEARLPAPELVADASPDVEPERVTCACGAIIWDEQHRCWRRRMDMAYQQPMLCAWSACVWCGTPLDADGPCPPPTRRPTVSELDCEHVRAMAEQLAQYVDSFDGVLLCPRNQLRHKFSFNECADCPASKHTYAEDEAVHLSEVCWWLFAQGLPMPVAEMCQRLQQFEADADAFHQSNAPMLTSNDNTPASCEWSGGS